MCPAFAPWGRSCGRCRRSGQVEGSGAGPQVASNRFVNAVAQGRVAGRCGCRRLAVVTRRAAMWIRRRRMAAVVAVAGRAPAILATARARLNAMVAATVQAALAANTRTAGGSGAVLQIGDDPFDVRVVAVVGIGVQHGLGRVREHGVVAISAEQPALPSAHSRVEVLDPAHDWSDGDPRGLRAGGERGALRDFGDRSVGDPPAGKLVDDGIGVRDRAPPSVTMLATALVICGLVRALIENRVPALRAAPTAGRR